MPSKCTCIAATFTTHPWVIRNSDSILSRYVGDTATIEILSDGKCNVHEGKAKHVGPAPRQTPAQWGSYRSKCQVRGVTIMVRYPSICSHGYDKQLHGMLCRRLSVYPRLPSLLQPKAFDTCCMTHPHPYVNVSLKMMLILQSLGGTK